MTAAAIANVATTSRPTRTQAKVDMACTSDALQPAILRNGAQFVSNDSDVFIVLVVLVYA